MAWESRKKDQDVHRAEVAEFILSEQGFGINGSKIKEIVLYDQEKVTKPPFNHPSVVGVYLFRGKTVPLIDLRAYLAIEPKGDLERQVVVVTEFNEMSTAFLADRVNRIHRITWDQIKPLNSYMSERSPQTIGTITIETREILLLDLEQIIGEIFPNTVINYDESSFAQKPKLEKRHEAKVFFAEDSYIIRTQLLKVLNSIGYTQVRPFENGMVAFNAITKLVDEVGTDPEALAEHVNLLISDIEMPQMDGMELCERVKKQMGLKVPVIMFSSLITEQIDRKCKEVGANASVSKPQTERLIDLMDGLCFPE